MDDNNELGYETEAEPQEIKENKKPENTLRTVFIIVIIVFAVLAILIGVLVGLKKSDTQALLESTTDETTTLAETTTEAPAEPYEAGVFKIETGGAALLFRGDHSKEADSILEIQNGTELNIVEIYHDIEAAGTDYEYWGKTTYLGHTGWVSMAFLTKAYSDNVVLPEDVTTAVSETTTKAAETTTKTAEKNETTTNKSKQSETTTLKTINETTTNTAAETTTNTTAAVGGYKAGDYKVSTGGSTLTFRKAPGTTGEVIMDLSDGTAVTVLEVVDNASSDTATRYWGKINYKGYTGYVCMKYLSK